MITWRKGITLLSLLGSFVGWSIVGNAQAKRLDHIETLDARTWDFSKRLPLSGNWSVVENKIVTPEDLYNENLTTVFFPSIWNNHRADGKGIGYATYALNVLIPDSLGQMALEIPSMNTSYNVWANGKLIASAGTVGVSRDESVPQWVHKIVSFSPSGDTIRLVVQLSNFHHHKGGGGRNAIYLGTDERIKSHFNWAIASNVSEAIVLALEGIIFLFVYWKMNKPVILFFSLLCITWSIRSIFSNLYPLILVFPDFNWEWQVKIEYITLYLTCIWAALFFSKLFRENSNFLLTYLPIVLNVIFVIFTLLTPPIVYTRWIST